MNINQTNKLNKNITVKHALKQLERHKEGLLSRNEVDKVKQTDSFIRTLERSNEDFLLEAYDQSKEDLESSPEILRDPPSVGAPLAVLGAVGGGFACVALASATSPLAGLAFAIGVFGGATIGGMAGTSFANRRKDNAVFVENSQFCTEAILNPLAPSEDASRDEPKREPILDALDKMSQTDLLEAYDGEIGRAPLSQQSELREKREKIRLLPKLNATQLWTEYPKLKESISDAVGFEKKVSDSESLADMPIHEAITRLEANRQNHLSHLQVDAALETDATIQLLRHSKGKTLFDAYSRAEKKRRIGTRLADWSQAALVAGSALSIAATPGSFLFAAGSAGFLGGGLSATLGLIFRDRHRHALELLDRAEVSIQSPLEPNPVYTKLKREELFAYLDEKFDNSATLEEKSFARQASRRLETLAGESAFDMFENTYESGKHDKMRMLKSVLLSMPKDGAQNSFSTPQHPTMK